ncbi:DNA repair protein RadC [Desulfothermus naphthae]
MKEKKEKTHYIGHRKRLKQKFLQESKLFYDYEVLELLLSYGLPRKDTKSIAKQLLNKFNNLKGVIFAPDHELLEVNGISTGLLTFIKVLRELITRIEEQDLINKDAIKNPKEVFLYLRHTLGLLDKEHFYLLLLNSKNKIISLEEIAQGTVNYLNLYPREIVEVILKKRAVGVIFIHNHPGGDSSPSKEDLEITKKFKKLLKEIDVTLLDHIIISKDNYFSFKENNVI